VIGMAAGGVSPYRMVTVPVALALLLALFSGYFLIVGEPWGLRRLDELMSNAAQRALASGVRVGEFNQWVSGVTFYAEDEVDGTLRNVVFADRRDEARPVVISARSGIVNVGEATEDIVFDLADGSVLLTDRDTDVQRVLRFEKSQYRLNVKRIVRNKLRTVPRVQMRTFSELWDDMHTTDVGKREDSRRIRATIVFHRKLAFPFATLIFALLAVPLAIRATGGSRARGFLYSAGIVGAYYYIGRAAELAARGQRFDPIVAAWLPNLIGLAVLLVLLNRLPRRAL
jgi:lipopolysaccharide export system permease protein